MGAPRLSALAGKRPGVSLLPPDATFEERVQDCFLAFRGSGLSLSAIDAALLRSWADLGIPFEVVARGIRSRAERALWDAKPGEPLLRSLRACRSAVEREFRHHLARIVGRGTDPEKKRRRQWRAAIRALASACPELVERLSSLEGRITTGDALAICAVRALPFRERIDLGRAVNQALALDPIRSAQARKLARRAARSAIFRKKFSLPNFW